MLGVFWGTACFAKCQSYGSVPKLAGGRTRLAFSQPFASPEGLHLRRPIPPPIVKPTGYGTLFRCLLNAIANGKQFASLHVRTPTMGAWGRATHGRLAKGSSGKVGTQTKKRSERSESPGGCETESDVGQTSKTGPGRMPIRGQVRVKNLQVVNINTVDNF